MNALIAINTQRPPTACPPRNLLGAIKAMRAEVGDALNDEELTRFLRESALPTEAGFAFSIFSKGYVTLSVPRQYPARWYPRQDWIAPRKERIARAIAEKYELSLYKPVDATACACDPQAGTAMVHHHLEFTDSRQIVIVAHPLYLKVCLFGKSPDHRYSWEPLCPLLFGPDLLKDLSRLYERKSESDCDSSSNPFATTTTLQCNRGIRLMAGGGTYGAANSFRVKKETILWSLLVITFAVLLFGLCLIRAKCDHTLPLQSFPGLFQEHKLQ